MLTISSEQTAEKLLQTYYNLKNQGVSLDREGENIFEDEKLPESFCNFLKNYFKMQVPANELSEKKTLGEALDAIIPYLPEDTTQLYSKMADIYCIICEDLDEQLAEEIEMSKKKDIMKMMFRVKVNTTEGDKVNIQLPMALIKIAIDSGMSMPQVSGKVDLTQFDWKQILDLVEQGVIGEIVKVDTAEGDQVSIIIE